MNAPNLPRNSRKSQFFCRKKRAPCARAGKKGAVRFESAKSGVCLPATLYEENNKMSEQIFETGSVADVVIAHPMVRPVLERLGVDYCCGGKKPFVDAVRDSGNEFDAVVAQCKNAIHASAGAAPDVDWSKEPLSALARHITGKHHAFTLTQLERCDMLLGKVQRAHSDVHGAMLDRVRAHFDAVREELESHMRKEEIVLFPAIYMLEAYQAGKADKPSFPFGRVANPIAQMEAEHDEAGDLLASIRADTDGFTLPPDSCRTFGALYDALPELEEDVHLHIHLENNILFPKSIALEDELIPVE